MKKIAASDIIFFTRQLATLLKANIVLTQALTILQKMSARENSRQLLSALENAVRGGIALSQALNHFPHYFPRWYCALVRCGEQTGQLADIFLQLASYQEKLQQLKKKIYKALFYPLVIVSVALIVTVGLMLFIVPQFAQLFASFGAALPWVTQAVMNAAQFLQHDGLYLLGGIISMVVIIFLAKQKNPRFALFLQAAPFHLPYSKTILHQIIIARLLRTLALTYASGIPLLQGLALANEISPYQRYQQAIQKITHLVNSGVSLSQAMQQSDLFSSLQIQMIHVGEESGELALMLKNLAEMDEELIDQKVSRLTTLLEPMLMVFLGIIIGGLVIAMYLPVFRLGSVV